MRGRRRARTSDLMIRSPPPSQGPDCRYTELARISQRVMRTSSTDACRFRRTKRYGMSLPAGHCSLILATRITLAPLFGFVGNQLAKSAGGPAKTRAGGFGGFLFGVGSPMLTLSALVRFLITFPS